MIREIRRSVGAEPIFFAYSHQMSRFCALTFGPGSIDNKIKTRLITYCDRTAVRLQLIGNAIQRQHERRKRRYTAVLLSNLRGLLGTEV